jgi:hypothetical protein
MRRHRLYGEGTGSKHVMAQFARLERADRVGSGLFCHLVDEECNRRPSVS